LHCLAKWSLKWWLITMKKTHRAQCNNSFHYIRVHIPSVILFNSFS
jgi:hypothetical protein